MRGPGVAEGTPTIDGDVDEVEVTNTQDLVNDRPPPRPATPEEFARQRANARRTGTIILVVILLLIAATLAFALSYDPG